MYETFKVKLTGVAPLLMHSCQLANPMSEASKRMKDLTSKRKKTDEDRAEIAHVEWMGSLYLNENQEVVVPGVCVEAMIIDAAKKDKLGKQAKASIICDGDSPLIFADKKLSPDDLWKLGKYTDIRSAKVQQNRVMRCRPIFRDWSVIINVSFNPELMDKSEVVRAIGVGGTQCGLGDYRPRFGRFEFVELDGK